MAQSFRVDFAFTGLSGGVGQLMAYNRQLRQSIMLQRQLNAGVPAGGGVGAAFPPPPSAATICPAPTPPPAPRQQRTPPTFVSRLAGLIGSTRVGMGGGSGGMMAMPLIGRMVGLLGATGGLGQGITIAVGALGMLAATAHEAAASLQSFRMAAATSGGTGGEISKLTSFGVAPGDIAGRAAALRERITSDPFAMAAGFKLLGGVRMPRPFGGTNEATDYLKVIEGLRGIKNAEEQLRQVRILGMEADLALIKTSERVFQEMKRDAEFRDKLFDPKSQQDAADFSGQMTRVANGMENIKVAAGKGLIPELTQAADGFANLANALAGSINQNLGAFTGAIKVLWGMSPGGWITQYNLEFLKLFGGGKGKGGSADPHTAAVKANTDALNKMGGIMREAGTFGGGARARGAIPEYLRGWTFDQAVAGKSISLGAFSP